MRRFATRLWMSFVRALASSMRAYRGNVVRINARACFALLLRAERACTGIWGKNTFQLASKLPFLFSSFFTGSQNSNNISRDFNFSSYVIFIQCNYIALYAKLITRIRFYSQNGWDGRIVTILTQYPRCNPTSVSWASPVGDDELHTRENKTKWNGGGRWAGIVTQSNTRNQTVLRPRCLESNTRHSTCYMHSVTMFRT